MVYLALFWSLDILLCWCNRAGITIWPLFFQTASKWRSIRWEIMSMAEVYEKTCCTSVPCAIHWKLQPWLLNYAMNTARNSINSLITYNTHDRGDQSTGCPPAPQNDLHLGHAGCSLRRRLLNKPLSIMDNSSHLLSTKRSDSIAYLVRSSFRPAVISNSPGSHLCAPQ